MTRIRGRGISASLRRAHVAIDNTIKTPAILEIVSKYGYPLEHMESGLLLYETANTAASARTIAAGTQSKARKEMRAAERKAFRAYQKLSEVAKAVYRGNRERLVELGLNRPMPRTTDAFLTAAFRLFHNASEADVLKDFGFTTDYLADEQAKIVAYQQTANEYQHAIGAAQLATQHRDAVLAAMSHWTDQYIRIARAVLKDEGQLLEKIGIQVRNRRTAAQRSAGKKAAATRAANQEREPEPEPA